MVLATALIVWAAFLVLILGFCRMAKAGMLDDDLSYRRQNVSHKTPITVGAPMTIEEARSSYGNYYGWPYWTQLPGSIYPAYASTSPLRELPIYVQNEIFETYRRSNKWNPLIPGTGQMGNHLDVLEREAGIGRNSGRYDRRNWTTIRYIIISSVGIKEEIITNDSFDGSGISRALDAWEWKDYRTKSVIQDGLRSVRTVRVTRRISAIIYVAIADMETRSILKSAEGHYTMAVTELQAASSPMGSSAQLNYTGAHRLARGLVRSALY